MSHFLDLDDWPRKSHFLFFKEYEFPFFNICFPLSVRELRRYTSSAGISFFLSYLYLSLKAANEIEAFRYRLKDEQVWVHDTLNAGSTVLNTDRTFSFCYFDYHEHFVDFLEESEERLAEFKAGRKSLATKRADDLIYYSVLPWLDFTSFSHARRSPNADSIPRFVFGKTEAGADDLRMPMSVEVHHALVDGYEVGLFKDRLQELFNDPASILLR